MNKEKSKTADMFGSGHFDPRTGKKWDTTPKTATPKVKKGVAQATVEEDSKSEEEDEETVLTSSAQILKANRFINISVHGGANSEEYRSFDGDAVSEFGIGCIQIDDTSLTGMTSHNQGVTFADAGQWVVQGRGRTKPVNKKQGIKTAPGPALKIKTGSAKSGVVSPDEKPVWLAKVAKRVKPSKQVKNKNTAADTREDVPYPMSAGAEGTVRTKNKGNVPTVKSKGTVPLDMGGKKTVLAELPTNGFTFDKWKCYFDSCATYHTFFVRDFLDRVYLGKTAMNGSCNAGTVTTNTRGWYGEFKVWLNEGDISNLLSIPMLEDAGYIVSTHTN